MASRNVQDVEPELKKLSLRWLFVAGFAAILLAYSLYRVDNYLTYSKGEEVLGNTLRELRSAQAEVSPGVSDPRQVAGGSSRVGSSIALTTVQEHEDHNSDLHSEDGH